MFDLSFEKIFVLLLVALFVLGPERLPAAAAWVGKTLRQVKGLAADANAQLQREVGVELDQLRKPLAELRALRDPRRVIMDHLLAEPGAASSPTTGPTPTAAAPRPPDDRRAPGAG